MRFEFKTDKQNFYEYIISFLSFSIFIYLIIVLTSISMNIGKISKSFEIKYLCNLFIVEKSSFNFKRLSNITKQTSKQKMWDICKEFIK